MRFIPNSPSEVATLMKRAKKFKELRQIRKKVVLSFLVFILLMTTGILTADYSVNSLMENVSYVAVISSKRLNNSFIEIDIMNKKLYVCTAYIDRDYKRLKNFMKNTFHF